MTSVASLLCYFNRRRAIAIRKYRYACLWVERQDARSWALHYGRLIRKMEKAQ